MVIAKNFKDFKDCLSDIIEGMYDTFVYEDTTFNMNVEDGSINVTKGTKTAKFLPSDEEMEFDDMIDEVVNKYKEFCK